MKMPGKICLSILGFPCCLPLVLAVLFDRKVSLICRVLSSTKMMVLYLINIGRHHRHHIFAGYHGWHSPQQSLFVGIIG